MKFSVKEKILNEQVILFLVSQFMVRSGNISTVQKRILVLEKIHYLIFFLKEGGKIIILGSTFEKSYNICSLH